jgi:hypothetical protein
MDAADTDKIAKVVGAIDQLSAGIESLKALGVIRSRKAFADFAEWVVAQILVGSWHRARFSQDGMCSLTESGSKFGATRRRLTTRTVGARSRVEILIPW